MRFRRAFIVLAACLAPPAVAAAQDARQVDIAYEITFAGISGFRIDVTARFNGSNYDVETSTFKEGMLKAVTMNYFGRNRAWGGFTTQGAAPTAGSLSISVDGKRRIDVLFKKIGMEPAAATGIPGAQGDVLVCEIYTKRVAGEFDEAPKEAETERERPIKIWLARFDNTQIRYPGKLEAQTLFATIRGKVLSFRERPMTPAEAEAIRR